MLPTITVDIDGLNIRKTRYQFNQIQMPPIIYRKFINSGYGNDESCCANIDTIFQWINDDYIYHWMAQKQKFATSWNSWCEFASLAFVNPWKFPLIFGKLNLFRFTRIDEKQYDNFNMGKTSKPNAALFTRCPHQLRSGERYSNRHKIDALSSGTGALGFTSFHYIPLYRNLVTVNVPYIRRTIALYTCIRAIWSAKCI